jgi:hypothetical protein
VGNGSWKRGTGGGCAGKTVIVKGRACLDMVPPSAADSRNAKRLHAPTFMSGKGADGRETRANEISLTSPTRFTSLHQLPYTRTDAFFVGEHLIFLGPGIRDSRLGAYPGELE